MTTAPSLTREQLDERTLGILERAYTEAFGSGEHDQFVQLAHEYWHRLIAQARRALELEEQLCYRVFLDPVANVWVGHHPATDTLSQGHDAVEALAAIIDAVQLRFSAAENSRE